MMAPLCQARRLPGQDPWPAATPAPTHSPAEQPVATPGQCTPERSAPEQWHRTRQRRQALRPPELRASRQLRAPTSPWAPAPAPASQWPEQPGGLQQAAGPEPPGLPARLAEPEQVAGPEPERPGVPTWPAEPERLGVPERAEPEQGRSEQGRSEQGRSEQTLEHRGQAKTHPPSSLVLETTLVQGRARLRTV